MIYSETLTEFFSIKKLKLGMSLKNTSLDSSFTPMVYFQHYLDNIVYCQLEGVWNFFVGDTPHDYLNEEHFYHILFDEDKIEMFYKSFKLILFK